MIGFILSPYPTLVQLMLVIQEHDLHFRSDFAGESLTAGRLWVKVKFSLEQAMKAQRESRGIALLFL
jgi:hypothetical protein